MKNFKDITLSIFAIIGFLAILSSFNNQPQQQTHGTPESHVWEFGANMSNDAYLFNKVTGEVRALGDAPDKVSVYDLVKRRN